eukprot:6456570-Amphidinium_carterae.1
MSKQQLAAQKGVQTKKRLKQAQEGLQAVAAANQVFNQTSLDTVAEEVITELKKDRALLYNVRTALTNGTLAALLGDNEEGAANETPKKEMLRSTCRRTKDLPQKVVARIFATCSPSVYERWNANDFGDMDCHDVLCYGLHATRDTDLGWKQRPQLQEVSTFLQVCKSRYEQMGSRLDKGLPETLAYWKLDLENKGLTFAVNGMERTYEIWLPELPDDMVIKHDTSFEFACLQAPSIDFEVKCTSFISGASASCEWEDDGSITKHMVKESVPWTVSEDVVQQPADAQTATTTTTTPTTTTPNTSSDLQTPAKRKAMSTLEARLKEKARKGV